MVTADAVQPVTDHASRLVGGSSSAVESLDDLIIADPCDDPEWDREVLKYPVHSVFHGAGWARVLSRTYGHRPTYVKGSDGTLVPLMEVNTLLTSRRGIGLPFSDLCPPISPTGDGFDHRMVKGLEHVARKRRWRRLELRGIDLSGSSEARPAFYGHELDLSASHDELFAGFHASARRAVRKAEGAGLQMRFASSESAVREFYALHLQTRKRHGAPPQPYRFFRHIHEELIRSGNGFVALADLGGRPVAGAVFLTFGGAAVYKFGASDTESWALRPNNLVMWAAIRRLAEAGMRTLHFGRTSAADEGLRRFKRSWGAREEAVHYSVYDPAINRWSAATERDGGGAARALFSRLPTAANRLAGTLIYPHLD